MRQRPTAQVRWVLHPIHDAPPISSGLDRQIRLVHGRRFVRDEGFVHRILAPCRRKTACAIHQASSAGG